MFRRRNKNQGTCSPGVEQAIAERDSFERLAAEIDAQAPERLAQRAEARHLRERGEASYKQNHFGQTIELAMRNKRAAH
jgi:hypothetical protein